MTKDTNGNERELHELIVAVCPDLVQNEHAQLQTWDGKTEYFVQHYPIRLSHILRAIEKKYAYGYIRKLGEFLPKECYRIVEEYNLTKDTLSEQSPEFKQWLLGILKPNLNISGL